MAITISARLWHLYLTNPDELTQEELKAIYRMEESRYEYENEY